jgi:PPK2 family polyphosphate:nucleotide phosphotransferase
MAHGVESREGEGLDRPGAGGDFNSGPATRAHVIPATQRCDAGLLLASREAVALAKIDTRRFRIAGRRPLSLARFDPADIAPFEDGDRSRRLLRHAVRRLYELTDLLAAQDRVAVLFIFQAMDGAGKDSVIKHVLRGLDPKVTQVFAFRTPSAEEQRHDFMWRCMKTLPERGRIGVFNRSYYEDVLVTRVHPELLNGVLRKGKVPAGLWAERFEDIRAVERYLGRNGVVIRKIFLNVSKAEQRRRFLIRLGDPSKRWKFSLNDVNERLRWKEYMAAYEEAMSATSTPEAPWYVIPADHKWFTRLAVARIAIETLESLRLHVPALTNRDRRAINHAKRRLRAP